MQRQCWPAAWLLTDERLEDLLEPAIARAAETGAGIIVRHHASPQSERRRVAALVKASDTLFGIARDVALASELGAALVHNPEGPTHLPFSLSIHDEAEALAAAARKPALVFVSPLYATRSHPAAAPLGEREALRLASMAGCPAVALGGVDEERGRKLVAEGWAGWAGIDAWIRT